MSSVRRHHAFGPRATFGSAVTLAVLVGGLVVGLVVADAAAPTFVVRAGSASAGTTVRFTVASIGTPTLKDVASGYKVGCTGLTINGSTTTGKHSGGVAIARLSGGTARSAGCQSGMKVTIQASRYWPIDIVSVAKGVATGWLRGVHLLVTPSGLNCRFGVRGRVQIRYINATHRLKLLAANARLTVHNVSSCIGTVMTGDKVTLTATLVVKASHLAYRPITIRNH